jgi:hypothetical protein
VRYFEILVAGFAAQPPPTEAVPKQRGRQKQSASKNLLDDLLRRAEQVLAFLDDLRIPFTNELVAYCTPSAWLACSLIFVSAFLRRVFIGWREDSHPMIIGPIHRKQTRPPPAHDGLLAHSIGFGGFVRRQQAAFA